MRFAILTFAIFMCTGCSTANDFCKGVTAGSALGGLNPFALPCIAHDVVYIGGKAVALSSSSSGGNTEYKTFRSSKAVYDDISNNGELMQFVIDSQDRYKSADYGDATSEQKTHSVGRYISNKNKPIVIVDAQKAFLVMYENEYTPTQIPDAPALKSTTNRKS